MLDQPLAHYFVAASHNTYLMDQDQLAGTSCVDMYRRVLLAGCRSVELDVWDGEEGEPIVTHGRTLCTKVKFEACVKAIAEAAFVNNPYPVSISLEIRCSRRQQSRAASILLTHLGDALLLPDDVPVQCSPKSLQRRILIKGKAPARHLPLREIDEIDETGGERAARRDAARTANVRARLKLHRCGAELPRTAVEISPPTDARQEGGVKLDPATGKFTMDKVPPEMRAVLEEIESSRRSRAPEMRAVLEEMERTKSAKEVVAGSAGDSLSSAGGSCRIGLCADHLVDGLPLPAAEWPLVEQRTSRRARVRPPRRPPPPVPMPELPVLWPPPRTTVRRASIRVLALYHLPTRREARPQLQGGAHSASLRCVPELNGPCAPPDAGATPSSPSVSISLLAIGGFCRVSQDNPPTEDAGTAFSTSAAIANGLNPVFHELVHCLAAEPNETVLKLGIVDADVEVAFATVVLGLLRPGYRSVQLRSRHGTRIQLCSLLVHIELANELSPITNQRDLMLEMRRQQLVISEQEKVIREQRERIQQLEAQERERLASFSSSSSSSSSSRIELNAIINDSQVQLKVQLRPAICEV